MKTIKHSKPTIGKEEVNAVRNVLLSGQLTDGNVVKKLEDKISGISGQKYAAALNSGTSGLHLALLALGIKKGDEVIIPSYVCQALLNAVYYTGAKPRLVDINLSDYNIDALNIKKVITGKCKAIIVPHMFGMMAEADAIKKIGLPIIEDCAMSIGSSLKGRPAGSFGNIAVFSFYATKVIAAGEGGAIATSNRSYYNKILNLREYDSSKPYQVRYNYKLSEINAAIALEQLKKLKKFINARKQIAGKYFKELNVAGLKLPISSENRDHIFYRYIIRSRKAQPLRKYLSSRGIICGRGVRVGSHKLLNIKKGFTNTDVILREGLSLPIYPRLINSEQDWVIKHIKIFIDGKNRRYK